MPAWRVAEVVFFGETIRLADSVSEWALMEFAEAAETVDDASLAGMAAVMRLLKVSVLPADWSKFRDLARANSASVEDCMPVVVEVFTAETGRPTVRPSDSSDGPPATSTNSTDASAGVAVRALAGRPDLQLMVLQAQEARSA